MDTSSVVWIVIVIVILVVVAIMYLLASRRRRAQVQVYRGRAADLRSEAEGVASTRSTVRPKPRERTLAHTKRAQPPNG